MSRRSSGSGRHRRVGRSWSWAIPLAIGLGAVVLALHVSGVPARTIASFGLIQVVGYLVPGTLLWRWLRGGPDSWLHDTVFGTIFAHAATILLYLAVRWAGAPLLVWAFSAGTVAAFWVVPGLRRFWRGNPERRQPAWFNLGAAGVVGLLAVWYAGSTVQNPIRGPRLGWQSTDHVFLLSLAGEIKNHVPPTVPFVDGERLNYHWFALADAAALSWQGGLELSLLVFRLLPMLCLVLGFLGFGLLAERLARRWSVGLVALVVAALVGSVSLLGGADTYVVDSTLLLVNWVGSPTQGFGQMLAMGVLAVAVPLVRAGPDRRTRASWVLLILLTVALMGAKATFLPVLGAGVLVVVVLGLFQGRGWRTPALGFGVLLAGALAFAQAVLFGASRQGLAVDPGEDFRRLGAWIQVPATQGTAALLVVVVALVGGWLAPLTGAGWLLLRRGDPAAEAAVPGTRRDPAVQLLTGMVLSGVAAVLVLSHPGFSEYFFLRSGLPFGYLLLAWSLVLAWDRAGRRTRIAGAAAAVLGLGYPVLTRILTDAHVDQAATVRRAAVVLAGAGVLAVLAGAAVAIVAARSAGTSRRLGSAFVFGLAGCLLGMGAARTVQVVADYPVPQVAPVGRPVLPKGAIAAMRFLRSVTGPDDYLATNAHCRLPDAAVCDVRAFWIAAYAERRVVIEGWGYTATINDLARTPLESMTLPYWNPALLALNDAVFIHPSRTTLTRLTQRYPVRWLVVDRRFRADLPGLRALLPEHRQFGQVTVFAVPTARR